MKFRSEEFLGYNACSLLKVSRHFGGTCRLHLQGGRISRGRKQVASRGLANNLARKLVLLYQSITQCVQVKVKLPVVN
jgi:hypothetical protein